VFYREHGKNLFLNFNKLYPPTENNNHLFKINIEKISGCSLCHTKLKMMDWSYVNICFHKYCSNCLSERIHLE
jgi:hypothetical protein